MERDRAAGTEMGDESPEHRGRLRLELEHVPTDDGVELVVKVSSAGSPSTNETFASDACSARSRATATAAGRPVDADDGAGLADELRDEERDIAATGPDVEDAHPACHARVDQEPACHRFDQRGLESQAPQFDLRVAEHVGSGLGIASGHTDSLRPRRRHRNHGHSPGGIATGPDPTPPETARAIGLPAGLLPPPRPLARAGACVRTESMNVPRSTCPTAQASWYDGVGHVPISNSPKRFNRELAALTRDVDCRRQRPKRLSASSPDCEPARQVPSQAQIDLRPEGSFS